MKNFIALVGVLLILGCDVRSQLPPTMPEDISISVNLTGGMMRAHRKITVTASTIEFDERKGTAEVKWSKAIARKDAERLYSVVVNNKFDTIKNDERTAIVHDAGSEYISVSLGTGTTFNAVYGKNSPMSGSNLKRFQAVSNAINDLLAKYQDPVEAGLNEEYLQGTWRAAGETPDRHTWFLEWTFDDGRFKQAGYPPITQKGKYRVVGSDGTKLTLELYDQDGTFGKETQRIEITVDSNRLTIQNMKGFSRVTDRIVN